jgi:CRP/FNR family transcriptional regulator, cyclic AMP receptor protein
VNKIKNIIKYVENAIAEVSIVAAGLAGNPWFILGHIVWFAAWIGFRVEPFPYGLLTMIVSLEAILISSLILLATESESDRDKILSIRNIKLSKETYDLLTHMHEDITDLRNKMLNKVDREDEEI